MLKKINLDKVLIISQDSSAMGGAEEWLTNLGICFSNKSIRVTLISNYRPWGKRLRNNNIDFVYVQHKMDVIGGIRGFIKFCFQLPWGLYWYYKVIKKECSGKKSVVLISGFTEKILATFICKFMGIPVVWVEHAPLDEVLKRNLNIPKYLYRMAMKWVPKVIVPTINTKMHLMKNPGINSNKVVVINLGVFIQNKQIKNVSDNKMFNFRKNLNISNSRNVIGILSRIQKEKGQDTLIKSLKYLLKNSNNYQVIIAGDGDTSELKRLATNEGVSGNVTFLGYLGEDEKWIFYKSLDVFVFPTRWEMEGFGIVLLEAMMMNVPIVATNFGPVPEILENSGVLVGPSPKELAKGIKMISENNKLKKDILIKQKKNITKYNIIDKADEYLKIFNNLTY